MWSSSSLCWQQEQQDHLLTERESLPQQCEHLLEFHLQQCLLMMLQVKEELSCSRRSLRSISHSPGVSSSLCHETANLPLLLLSAQRLAKVEMHGTRGCSSHPEGWAWGHLCVWDDALLICKERTSQDTLFPSSERREVFPPILSSQQKLQNQKGQGRLQSPCSELLLLLTDSTDGP